MSKPTLKITKDMTQQFNDAIKRFKNDEILVGIPQEKTERTDKSAEPINNATLLALANFGSAANNIPAWPVMAIGIKAAKDEIAGQYRQAAVDAFKKGFTGLTAAYERIGLIASNSIKKTINEQVDVPEDKPSPATMAAREARGFKGTKYWIVTGQMRNAITYVVKGGK